MSTQPITSSYYACVTPRFSPSKARPAKLLAILLPVLAAVVLCVAPARGSESEAWDALHQLKIAEAIDLFEAARARNPDDHALMRGLLLAHFLDGRYEPQVELLREAVNSDPANPYNLALYEHLEAELAAHAQEPVLSREVGRKLIELPPGALPYCGRQILISGARKTLSGFEEDWLRQVGGAPRAWVSGPYENGSRVCAVRPLANETVPLDTLAVAVGEIGVKAPWINMPSVEAGQFYVGSVMEDAESAAVQMRFPFRLGSDRDVIIVIGGECHYRLRVDAVVVAEDRSLANAVTRDAVRVPVRAGEHEITLVAGWETPLGAFSINLLDTLYQPIDDLEWLRIARPTGIATASAEPVNPIFDSFEAYVAEVGEEPDTRFWRAILQTYNARAATAIEELEARDDAGELTPLERFALVISLRVNKEQELGSFHLNAIRQEVTLPSIELLWLKASGSRYEETIRESVRLSEMFPDRPLLDFLAAAEPMLRGDFASFFAGAEAFEQQYPNQLVMPLMVSQLYQQAMGDAGAALEHFLEYCERGEQRRLKLLQGPDMYAAAKQFDSAIALARRAIDELPGADDAVLAFVRATAAAARYDEPMALVDSIVQLRPYNVELLSTMYALCNMANQPERARDYMTDIHRVKPTAWTAYKLLDSLHNDAPYDSIFTDVDVMSLWGEDPSEEELMGSGEYILVDRQQVVLFESGTALAQLHWSTVVLDRSSVESHQEVDVGFYPSGSESSLVRARRLRKGQAPLAGVHEGTSVYFKDLQPGDAVELVYRFWGQTLGDLWQQYWTDYHVSGGVFQRFWEFTVMTNRDDCRYVSTLEGLEPVVDTHFDFTRTTFSGTNTPAVDCSPSATPPYDDMVGKIFATTLSDWDVLGQWYAAISEAALDDNPRTARLARELTEGADSEREKLRRLYEFVVFNIPYQSMSFDYSASVPHMPDEVLVNLWGDCKDKGHLLIALLRAAGITSWPVLVMTRSDGTQLPIPFMGFDHLIVGCIIDGDTLIVEPSSVPTPVEHSIDEDLADQPCLHVLPDGKSFASRIPPMVPEEWRRTLTMTLSPRDTAGQYRLQLQRQYGNIMAGERRSRYQDEALTEIIKKREAYYSDQWGASVDIDSLTMDSLYVTDPEYTDIAYGTITLGTQELGSTMILRLPTWGPFRNSLPTDLYGYGERTSPVDLTHWAGDFRYVLDLAIPEGYGAPEVPEAVKVSDSLLVFEYQPTYDAGARQLRLSYRVFIDDGLLPVTVFEEYVRKVLKVFDSPVLLHAES